MVSDRGALYAGFFGTGVFKSVDHGDSWTPVGAGLPAVGDQFYTLAANEGLLLVAIGNQIFHSINGGMSWSGPAAGLSQDELVSNVIFSDGAAYASTTTRVVKSIDGGASWRPTGFNEFTRLVASSAGTLYAVTPRYGVLKSMDGGDSWTQTGLTRTDIYSFAASGGWLFAANIGNALGAGQPDHVFVSNDEGDSWSTMDQGLFVLGGVALAASDTALYAGTQGFGVQALDLLPERESIEAPVRLHRPREVTPTGYR